MSVHVTSWCWKSSAASGSTLLVALALADQADDDGLCWPSVKYLATKTRMSERAVQDRVRALVDAGEVTRLPRAGRSNHYRFTFRPGEFRQEGGADSAPPSTPAESAEGGAGGRTGGVRAAAPITVSEPSPTHQVPYGDDAAPSQATGVVRAPNLVVAAWCDGYAATHGAHPPRALVARMGRSARALAEDQSIPWDRVTACAEHAGRTAFLDLVQHWARHAGGAAAKPAAESRNAAILGAALERSRMAEEEGR